MTGQSFVAKATGPLRVHPKNPRYFTEGSSRAWEGRATDVAAVANSNLDCKSSRAKLWNP